MLVLLISEITMWIIIGGLVGWVPLMVFTRHNYHVHQAWVL